jgi:glutamate/tyrosine decarboxylase-like PLP-dependent enzyme
MMNTPSPSNRHGTTSFFQPSQRGTRGQADEGLGYPNPDLALDLVSFAASLPGLSASNGAHGDTEQLRVRLQRFPFTQVLFSLHVMTRGGLLTEAECAFLEKELQADPKTLVPPRTSVCLDPAEISHIPQHGISEAEIIESLRTLVARDRYQMGTGEALARPITLVHPFPAAVHDQIIRSQNPNLAMPFSFGGTWSAVHSTERMLLNLFRHPQPTEGGMLVLKSATQSLQQALILYLVRYYAEYGFDLRKEGLAEACARPDIPTPMVLASVTNNAALVKAVEAIGLGRDQLRFYAVDEQFLPCAASVAKTVAEIHQSGGRILAHAIVMGDTERGLAHDPTPVDAQVSDLCSGHGYCPPIIADAAAQWLNLAMLGGDIPWDFACPNIRALVIDPQKIELPYDHSLLLLRDFTDLRALQAPGHIPQMNHSDEKQSLVAHAHFLTSRGAAPVLSMYAYLLQQGLQGLRESRQRIIDLSRLFAHGLSKSPYYRLVVEPQTSVVAWTSTSSRADANWETASRINQNPKDHLMVAYSPILRARLPEDGPLRTSAASPGFDGLHVHVMEHNTEEAVEKLLARLEEVGRDLA